MAQAAKGKAAPAAKTATATKTTAVAKQEAPKAVQMAGVDADMLSEFLEDSGAGIENATAQDFALPFVYLLQKMSPQVDKTDSKYVPGAEPGKFFNSVTQEVFESLTVIHVEFQKRYIEWIPRDAGGGFVKDYENKKDAETNCGEGHQIVDTANHFVLLWSPRDEMWSPAIVSMTSTKLKASRNWVSKMSMVTVMGTDRKKRVAPTYSRFYTILPEAAKNEHGSFYVLKVEGIEGEDGWVKDAELRDQARNFRASLAAGTKGADYSKVEEVLEEVEEEGQPKY